MGPLGTMVYHECKSKRSIYFIALAKGSMASIEGGCVSVCVNLLLETSSPWHSGTCVCLLVGGERGDG